MNLDRPGDDPDRLGQGGDAVHLDLGHRRRLAGIGRLDDQLLHSEFAGGLAIDRSPRLGRTEPSRAGSPTMAKASSCSGLKCQVATSTARAIGRSNPPTTFRRFAQDEVNRQNCYSRGRVSIVVKTPRLHHPETA
jgi:hypothetical protein